jgi:hypothetical protein
MSFQKSFTAPPASPARRLLLTATQAVRSDAAGADFLLRRLADDVPRARPFERVFLRRLVLAMEEGAWHRLPGCLVEYACGLERRGALPTQMRCSPCPWSFVPTTRPRTCTPAGWHA